jgi:hypothetical protein
MTLTPSFIKFLKLIKLRFYVSVAPRHWVPGARLCEKINGLISKGRNDHEFQPLETATLSRNFGFQSPNVMTSHTVRTNISTAPLESPKSCKHNLLGHKKQHGKKYINVLLKQGKLTKCRLNFKTFYKAFYIIQILQHHKLMS